MEWLSVDVGLLPQRQEENTSLRILLRTWPRRGIQRGAFAAAPLGRRGYPRTLVAAPGWQVDAAIVRCELLKLKVRMGAGTGKDRLVRAWLAHRQVNIQSAIVPI
ncbi:hypothetical protein QQP08_007406 [Theobroma cacao]|nr:hypothetical protein QQP08_007406 [Theobroma cacao]